MDKIDMTIRPATLAERKYAFAVSPEEAVSSGSIGYLRGDFGSGGESFYHTWFDSDASRKTQAFKDEFDAVINTLRSDPAYGGILKSRTTSQKYCWDHPESAMQGDYTTQYIFRIDTDARVYILRLNPIKGDYNFSCHAFDRETLKQQIQGQEQKANEDLRESPVYRYPASYARENNEMDTYRASRKACIACKEAIEKAIIDNYRDNILSPAAAKQVVETYGFERTMYVLAVTIRHKDWDGRFSRSNKEWAETQPVFEDLNGAWDSTGAYVVDKCHPGLTNLFIDQVRHDYLLTQPLTEKDIQTEANRILKGFQSYSTPNSPNGTHYMVQVSDDFMYRVRGHQTSKLSRYMPFQSFALSRLKDKKGFYAMISKSEDRFKPLREIKPSVRGRLQEKAPQQTSPNNSAKLKEPER